MRKSYSRPLRKQLQHKAMLTANLYDSFALKTNFTDTYIDLMSNYGHGETTLYRIYISERVNIKRAKQDCLARKFYNKNYTSADDFHGAIAFWIGVGFPKGSLRDFLIAIEPASGWNLGQDEFKGGLPTRRYLHEYGATYMDLMAGSWVTWLPGKKRKRRRG